MGCDIHIVGEHYTGTKWKGTYLPEEWSERSYRIFAFLAGVRNSAGIPPIAEPRGKAPDPSYAALALYEEMEYDAHSHSWLLTEELTSFNYDALVEDRRCAVKVSDRIFDASATCKPGDGTVMTWREFLGSGFVEMVYDLKIFGIDRLVFFFDN